MKRIILFLPLLLLIYINSQAGNKDGKSTLALVADFNATVRNGCVLLLGLPAHQHLMLVILLLVIVGTLVMVLL